MKNWDDFISLFDGLVEELNKLTEALEKIRVACSSMTKTYENMLE